MIKVYWIHLEEVVSFCECCEKTILQNDTTQCFFEEIGKVDFDCTFYDNRNEKLEKEIVGVCPYDLLKYVNKQRREKILRCKNKKDRLRSLFAGLLLRFALEEEGIDYDTAEFSYGEHGKPMLSHYEYKNVSDRINLYKNIYQRITIENSIISNSITHSSNYVACAISDENIGIDLEETNRKLFLKEREKQLLSMAKRICTKKEYAYFSALPREEQVRAYLELWTRKESFAKADGRGLAIGFDKIEVLGLEELECKTKIAKADCECLFYDKMDNKVACIHKQVKKADCACPFYTTWITDSVCMSIYSEKTKTILNIPLTQKQIYDYVEKRSSL